jgi:hypothetical protein
VEQDHRIRAAGNGDENFLSTRKQIAFLNFAFGALEEFAHATMLLFLARWASSARERPPTKNYCASLSR